MKFKIYLSVKFRAFGITFGTVKKEWERDLPRQIIENREWKLVDESNSYLSLNIGPIDSDDEFGDVLVTAAAGYKVPILGNWVRIIRETELKWPSNGTHTAIKERGINLTYEWTMLRPTILRDTDKIKP
jgi:hypothetical protein